MRLILPAQPSRPYPGSSAVAGVIATLVMTVVMVAEQRAGWMRELAPTRVTRRSLDGSPVDAPDGPALAGTTALVHLAVGGGAGAGYALLHRIPGVARLPAVARGLLFGTGLWATAYAGVLPAIGLMPPPGRDERRRPFAMLLAHWVYGVTLAILVTMWEERDGPIHLDS